MVEVLAIGQYKLIGESLDDAAGEAFDKVAKMLDLPYPGGPQVAELAKKGNPERFVFPRPMTNRPGLDFSFSGLKTATLNTVEDAKIEGVLDEQTRADIAWAFQEAVADTMVIKCRRAFKHSGMRRLVIAGGVSANTRLREKLALMAKQEGGELFYPGLEVLHRQWCHDCLRRLHALAGRAAGRPGYSGKTALEHGNPDAIAGLSLAQGRWR